MFNQKGFLKIAIIIIILAVMAVFYLALGRKNQNTSQNDRQNTESNQPSVEKLSIKDWKIYTDKEFGLEIKYPQNWTLSKVGEIIVITEKIKEYKIEIKKIKNSVIGYAKQADMLLFMMDDIAVGRFKENKYDERVSLTQFNTIFKTEPLSQTIGADLQLNKGVHFYEEKYLSISYFGSEKEPLATALDNKLINEMDEIVKTLKFKKQ